jgi:cellulose synthase (UDP-forming)
MFCCGTNVMFRREALVDVGGLDETSVTEDFATSIKLHLKGWHSLYINRISSFGMGPNDLGGYFKQQFRWSLGTVGMFREIIAQFFRNPKALPARKWWEYGVSSTYYFVGWVFLIMFLCPVIYIFFGVPAFFAHPWLFAMVFAPYLTLTLLAFLLTLSERNYRVKEIFIGLMLTQITFPVYIKATAQAACGIKGSFGITPKAGSVALPLRALWPHVLAVTAAAAAVAWGANRLYYGDGPPAALAVNMFWAAYQGGMLCSIFWFNRPSQS